jgi:cytochrome P450
MRSITLTVLTRTLLSSDIGADAIDEIERLLRVLLSELVARGISANVPGLAWVPTRSNQRFSAANRRLRALLTDVIDGYRTVGADHGDLISILMHARDDDTGAGMTNEQLDDSPCASPPITTCTGGAPVSPSLAASQPAPDSTDWSSVHAVTRRGWRCPPG